MSEFPELTDDFPRDDPTDRYVQGEIALVEEDLFRHQCTLELHQSFSGLKNDERFKVLMAKMAEQRANLMERLSHERHASLDQVRWFQAYIQAMSYFTQLSKGDPEEVRKARLELPVLTDKLATLRRLLHVPTGADLDSGARDDSGRQE